MEDIVILILRSTGVGLNITGILKTNQNGEASVGLPLGEWTIFSLVKLEHVETKDSSSNKIALEKDKTYRLKLSYKKSEIGNVFKILNNSMKKYFF